MIPDQTAPKGALGSSLIRVHSVCLHDKIYSKVNLKKNRYAADILKSRQHFYDKKIGRLKD